MRQFFTNFILTCLTGSLFAGNGNELNLISVEGKVIGSTGIDVSGILMLEQFDLKPGIYFLQVTDNNKVVKVFIN